MTPVIEQLLYIIVDAFEKISYKHNPQKSNYFLVNIYEIYRIAKENKEIELLNKRKDRLYLTFVDNNSSRHSELVELQDGLSRQYEREVQRLFINSNNKKELIDNKVRIVHDHSVSIDKSVKRVAKHKILKKSQRYYCKAYQKANLIQMGLLYITDFIYRGVLYIRCLIRR